MDFFRKKRKGGLVPDCFRGKPTKSLGYQTASMQGIGNRSSQEDVCIFVNDNDAHMIRKQGLLAVVADGMGGMQGGDMASRTVVQELAERMPLFDRREDLGEQLENSALAAGEKVYAALGGSGGSTLIAALIYNEKLYFSCVGDSYFYLLRAGELLRLNRVHNLLTESRLSAIEAGHMPAEEDENISEADALSLFLGMPDVRHTDRLLRPMKLLDGDVLLLCSDGIGGVLDEAAIAGALSGPSASAACRVLESDVVQAGNQYQDNYTALVIRCVQ